jgi:predicted transcriptional regulator
MVLVAFRVPPALANRLDKLARELSTQWHEMKRSEVARAAVERGLDALEQEAAERRQLGE